MIKLYEKFRYKIMIAVYIILAAILIPDLIPDVYINPEFQKHYDDYMGMVEKNCKEDQYNKPRRLFIDFDDLDDSAIGYCEIRIFSYYIKIDRRYWLESNENEHEKLLFHELAHCIIDKDHVSDVSNYMFFMTQPLDEVDVRRQVIEDIKDHCEVR